MKKLICARDVEELARKKEKTINVCADTILTPSAKDVAKSKGIKLVYVDSPIDMCEQAKNNVCTEAVECKEDTDSTVNCSSIGNIDSEVLLKLILDVINKN